MNTYNTKKPNVKLIVAAAIAAVIVLNVLAQLLPDSIRRFDVTRSKSYTLADSTVEYFSSLDEAVTVYVFDADGSDVKFEYMIERIDNCSDNVAVKWVNSEDSADILEPLGITPETKLPYLLVVEGEKRSTAASYADLITYRTTNSNITSFLGTNEMTAVQYEYLKQMFAEYAQTSSDYAAQYAQMLEALIYDVGEYFNAEPYLCSMVEYVTVDIIPVRYTLTGHGETDLDSTEIGYYLSETVGMIHNKLDLSEGGEIPEDAVSIIIMDPTEDLKKSEADLLIAYLNNGGQLTVFTSDEDLDMPNLMSVMAAYGLSAEKGIVGEVIKVEIEDDADGSEGIEDASGDTVENTDEDNTDDNTDEGNTDENTDDEVQYELRYTDEVGVFVNTDHAATSMLAEMSVFPTISKGNSILFSNSAGLTLTPILTTSESAYIGDNTEELAARAVAAVSDKEGGGTLLWFTGAESYTVPILENTDDSEQVTKLYSNCALVVASLSLAPFSYESTVTVPDAKYYGERLMSVTETSFVAHAIVIAVLVVIFSVVGVIIWYRRKKA